MSKPLVYVTGGAAALFAAVFARLYAAARTGVDYLDSFGFRARLVLATLAVFPESVLDVRPLRALASIAHNEFDPRKPIGAQLGDQALSGGPSVGPFQVYRSTAVALGLWTPPAGATDEQVRAAYADNARHPLRMAYWGARVFADKLKAAKGDFADAIRRYNGSGAGAESYKSKALAFAGKAWGSDAFAGKAA